jgi:hypothetical protein
MVKKGRRCEKKAIRAEKRKGVKEKNLLAQTKGQKRDLSLDEDDDMEDEEVRGGSPVKFTKKNPFS